MNQLFILKEVKSPAPLNQFVRDQAQQSVPPKVAEAILQIQSDLLSRRFDSCLRDIINFDFKTTPILLDSDSLESLIDRSESTTVFTSGLNISHFQGGFAGCELLALRAAELRKRSQRAPNIIYLPRAPQFFKVLHLADGQKKLAITHGILIRTDNSICFGQFKNPLPVENLFFKSPSKAFLEILRKTGTRRIDSEATEKIVNSKILTYRLLKHLGMNVPAQLVFHKNETSELQVRNFLNSNPEISEIVVKPNNGSQARDVYFFDRNDLSGILKAIKLIQDCPDYDDVLVQERVRPIYLEIDGKEVNWVVRVLANDQGLLDLEVKYNLTNEPVTGSGQNLATWEDFREKTRTKFGDRLPSKQEIIPVFQADTQRLSSRLNSILLGFDFNLGEANKLTTIEVNGLNSGGIRTLAKLGMSEEERYRTPDLLLKYLSSDLQLTPQAMKVVDESELQIEMDLNLNSTEIKGLLQFYLKLAISTNNHELVTRIAAFVKSALPELSEHAETISALIESSALTNDPQQILDLYNLNPKLCLDNQRTASIVAYAHAKLRNYDQARSLFIVGMRNQFAGVSKEKLPANILDQAIITARKTTRPKQAELHQILLRHIELAREKYGISEAVAKKLIKRATPFRSRLALGIAKLWDQAK